MRAKIQAGIKNNFELFNEKQTKDRKRKINPKIPR